MDSKQQIIYQQALALDDRFTYFLLALAAAGVGYSIERSDSLSGASWAEITLAAASIMLWGASFVFGCLKLLAMRTVLQKNLRHLQLAESAQRLESQGIPISPAVIDLMRDNEQEMHDSGSRQRAWLRWQLVSIALAAATFVAWRVTAIFPALVAATN